MHRGHASGDPPGVAVALIVFAGSAVEHRIERQVVSQGFLLSRARVSAQAIDAVHLKPQRAAYIGYHRILVQFMAQADGFGLLLEQVDHRGAMQTECLDPNSLDKACQPLGAPERA
ncbi:hypothetical protein D3C75_1030240 [compost metagenome]